MAKESENIVSELRKERERSPGTINLTFGPTAVIIAKVSMGLGRESKNGFKGTRWKILSEM